MLLIFLLHYLLFSIEHLKKTSISTSFIVALGSFFSVCQNDRAFLFLSTVQGFASVLDLLSLLQLLDTRTHTTHAQDYNASALMQTHSSYEMMNREKIRLSTHPPPQHPPERQLDPVIHSWMNE